MSQPQLIVDSFRSVLKPAGFRQKKDNWFLSNDDTVVVVNLQKSSYSKKYYVNIGIWLKVLGDVETPQHAKCHVRCRIGALLNQHEEPRIGQLFDLEDESFTEAARSHEIGALLTEYLIPFVDRVKTVSSLASFYHSAAWPKACLVRVEAQEILTTASH